MSTEARTIVPDPVEVHVEDWMDLEGTFRPPLEEEEDSWTGALFDWISDELLSLAATAMAAVESTAAAVEATAAAVLAAVAEEVATVEELRDDLPRLFGDPHLFGDLFFGPGVSLLLTYIFRINYLFFYVNYKNKLPLISNNFWNY